MPQEYTYKIFYSSRDASGRMWCGDCRAVESKVASTFTGARECLCVLLLGNVSPPSVPLTNAETSIIYVGQQAEWNSPSNMYRLAPWYLTSVPTILKVSEDGRIVARIEERDVLVDSKMEGFLGCE